MDPRECAGGARAQVAHDQRGDGRSAYEAVRVRTNIRRMVESGAVADDKAAAWQKALEEEEEVAALRRKAEGGDVRAMNRLGLWYDIGLKGLPKDEAQAFAWYKRVADLDDPRGLYNCGVCYVNGKGVERNVTYRFTMIAQAVGLGAEPACFNLAICHRDGCFGFPKDEALTRKWFRKMETCEHKDCPGQYREKSAEWLRAHPERS